MFARVTLEIALRKEFDYAIPPELAGQVEVGTRVKVPFGHRQVMGCVTALVEHSTHTNLRHLTAIVGKQSLVTARVLQLARWIADYYCCAPEIALKSVLPEVVRREQDGWRERLFVRLLPATGAMPKLTKRQQEILNLLEERRELPLHHQPSLRARPLCKGRHQPHRVAHDERGAGESAGGDLQTDGRGGRSRWGSGKARK